MSALTELRATACMIGTSLWHGIAGPLRRLVFVLGGIALVMVVLAATRLPFDAHRALGTAAGECDAPAELLVVLGGSGMPSAAELRRLYHAAEVAQAMPAAAVLVIHPGDPAVLQAMVAELQLRGVGAERIRSLNEGDNTRAQALAVRDYLGATRPSLVLVTAPENMYRSVRAFRAVGLAQRLRLTRLGPCHGPCLQLCPPRHRRQGLRARCLRCHRPALHLVELPQAAGHLPARVHRHRLLRAERLDLRASRSVQGSSAVERNGQLKYSSIFAAAF